MEAGLRKLLLILPVTAVILSACTQTQFVYNHLDWYAGWRAHQYVSLKTPQKDVFKREFAGLWAWHRREQLPVYADDLRRIAASLKEGPVSAADVQRHMKLLKTHGQRTVLKSVSDFCPLMRSLDDRQAGEIVKAIDRQNGEFSRKFVEPPEATLRKNSEKAAVKWLTTWTGPLNDSQKNLVNHWAASRRVIGREALAYRERWTTKFQTALTQRNQSGDCSSFGRLFVKLVELDDPAYARDRAYNEELWSRLLAGITDAMDQKQREHAVKELHTLAGQFDALARQIDS